MQKINLEGTRVDALTMLREDHRRVKEMFRQFNEAQDSQARKGIADNAIAELEIHAELEEEIFYPAVQRETGDKEMIEEAEEEHHVAEMLMDQLADRPAGTNFDAKFKVLMENVLTHIEEEESTILPEAAEAGTETLTRLGRQMAERRQEILHEMESTGQKRPARRRNAAGRPSTARRSSAAKSRSTAKSASARARSNGARASSSGATKRPAKSRSTNSRSRSRSTARR